MPLSLLKRTVKGLARRLGMLSPAHEGPSEEKSSAFYDAMYADTAEYQRPYAESHYYFLWSVIADRVRLGKIERILEIGCGPGQLAAFLLDQGVKQYTGLDFSPFAIQMAQMRTPGGNFVVGDARDGAIHLRTDHQAVICTEVLEHIDDDLSVVSAFLPGKRCLCSVPNFPYESHVRHFRSADEVRERYGRFFTALDVAVFPSPRDANDRFYLLDGVRNDVVHKG